MLRSHYEVYFFRFFAFFLLLLLSLSSIFFSLLNILVSNDLSVNLVPQSTREKKTCWQSSFPFLIWAFILFVFF